MTKVVWLFWWWCGCSGCGRFGEWPFWLAPWIMVQRATLQNNHTQNGHKHFCYQNGNNQNGHTAFGQNGHRTRITDWFLLWLQLPYIPTSLSYYAPDSKQNANRYTDIDVIDLSEFQKVFIVVQTLRWRPLISWFVWCHRRDMYLAWYVRRFKLAAASSGSLSVSFPTNTCYCVTFRLHIRMMWAPW